MENECLKELTQDLSVNFKAPGIYTQKGAGKARIAYMKFRRFDETALAITLPWEQPLYQERSLEQLYIASRGRPAQLK